MSNISINTGALGDKQSRIKGLSRRVNTIQNSLGILRWEIDSDIKGRQNIDRRMSNLYSDLGELEKRLNDAANIVEEARKRYDSAEKELEKKISNLTYEPKPHKGWFSSFLDRVKSLITKRVEKVLDIMALLGIFGPVPQLISSIHHLKDFFDKKNNKPVDQGITTRKNEIKIPPFKGTLSYNPHVYNAEVALLQKRLNELGYHLKVDGYFGEKTLAAVNDYKNKNKLWNTGEYAGKVGETTWKHIFLNSLVPYNPGGEASGNGTSSKPGTGSKADLVSLAEKVIFGNEGSYTDVAKNDGGALSIGKIQWHGSRARDLLKLIESKNKKLVKDTLPDSIYDNLDKGDSYWKNRVLDDAEVKAIEKLLGTKEGKEAQDEQSRKDVSNYIDIGRKLGITDSKALIYFADLYNQRPASAYDIVHAAEGGKGLTLEAIHQAALANGIMGKYKNRRNTTYNACKNINLSKEETKPLPPNETKTTPPPASGNATIPQDAWKPVTPGISSKPGQRSSSLYSSVIDQFNVEKNGRYTPHKLGKGDTYCNIFAWDVTKAMGAEIPHWIDKKTGAPRQFPDVKGAVETNANGAVDWLRNHGAQYGWRKVSAAEAQAAANRGEPSVAVWKNPKGSGHFQVVRPAKSGDVYSENKGVFAAQAGGHNYNYITASEVYGAGSALDKLEYYTHD